MKIDVENNEWKTVAPYLASLPKVNPFRIPEQYLENLSSSLNNSKYIMELKEAVTTSGFTVPENYFINLQAQTLSQTVGVLNSHNTGDNGYTTPPGYFSELQASILAKTIGEKVSPEKKETKVVRLWRSDLIKYASAACFILISAFGLYLNQQSFTQETLRDEMANEQMLYDIDEQDIIDLVQTNYIDENQSIGTETELESYILNNYSQNDLSADL